MYIPNQKKKFTNITKRVKVFVGPLTIQYFKKKEKLSSNGYSY